MDTRDWTEWPSQHLAALKAPDLLKTGAPMQQHPLYGAACAAMGAEVRAFTFGEGVRGARGWAQILVRRWPGLGQTAMLARGPVWADDLGPAQRAQALRSLLARLRKRYRVVMATPDRIEGTDPLAQTGWLSLVSPGTQARLDLMPDTQTMRDRLHGKWRNRLVRAEASSLRVTLAPLPMEPDHWLLSAEEAQAKTRGYKRLPAAFALAWRAAGGARTTLLAQAHDGDTPVAGMLFLRHGSHVSYHTGWTSDAGRAVDAHRLLLFRAACRLAEKGASALSLGTLDTVTTPGLARFKLGAGAVPITLGATRIRAPGSALIAQLAGDGPRRADPAPLGSPDRGLS